MVYLTIILKLQYLSTKKVWCKHTDAVILSANLNCEEIIKACYIVLLEK